MDMLEDLEAWIDTDAKHVISARINSLIMQNNELIRLRISESFHP
jgi:hypothetical protein